LAAPSSEPERANRGLSLRAKRSNLVPNVRDCFAALAMTNRRASAVGIRGFRRWSFAALGANQFRAAFLARIDDVLDVQVGREDLDRPKGKVADPALRARNNRGGKRGGPKTHASLVERSPPNNASARSWSIELWANFRCRAALSASLAMTAGGSVIARARSARGNLAPHARDCVASLAMTASSLRRLEHRRPGAELLEERRLVGLGGF
jgi:hypothetical protein